MKYTIVYKDIGDNKIPEEMIANEIPKWCELGDSLYEFLTEQIRKNMEIVESSFVHIYLVFVKRSKKRKNK